MKPKILLLSLLVISTLFTHAQRVKWVSKVGGSGNDRGNTIVLDSDKSVYIGLTNQTGTSTSINGGCTATGGTGTDDAVYGVVDSTGACLYCGYISKGSDELYSIYKDASGNSYVTGYVTNTTEVCSLATSVRTNPFYAKYTSGGSCSWAYRISTAGGSAGTDIRTDVQGNVYVAGYFQGSVIFNGTTYPSKGTMDGFLVKYNSSGTQQWVKQIGGYKVDMVYSISDIVNGVFYITGQFDSTAIFGSDTLTKIGGGDVFIAKMDTGGNFLWAKKAGSNIADYGTWVTQDAWGNVFLSGITDSAAVFGSFTSDRKGDFLARYDASGNVVWLRMLGKASSMKAKQQTAVYDSTIYYASCFDANSTIGSYSITHSGSDDIYVAKLDYNGKPLWVKRYGDTGMDRAYSITCDADGAAYITGTVSGTVVFDSDTIVTSGSRDGFILKLAPIYPITSAPATVCKGDTFYVTFKSEVNAGSGNVFRVQLSDSTGSFATVDTIGAKADTLAGSIACVIGSNIPAGSHYRIRIVSSNPSLVGEEWQRDVRVNYLPEWPTIIQPQWSFNDSGAVIHYKEIYTPTNGALIEWSSSIGFDTISVFDITIGLQRNLNYMQTDRIWWRSHDTITSCYSPVICAEFVNTFSFDEDTSYDSTTNFYAVVSRMERFIEEQEDTAFEEDGDINKFLRWKSFWGSRINGHTGEQGDIEQSLLWYIQNPDEHCTQPDDANEYFQSAWESMGPNDDQQHKGRVNQIWVDPNDDEHLIIGTSGGVWETTGSSSDWHCLTDNDNGGIPSVAVSSMAVRDLGGGDLDIRLGLGGPSSGYHEYTHNYGFGVANRDPQTGMWSIDEIFLQAYATACSCTTALPKVNSVAFKPGTGDLYVGSERYIFKRTNGGSSYSVIYDAGNNYSTLGNIQFSNDDPDKILATIDGPSTRLLYSNDAGNNWQDVTYSLFQGTSFKTDFETGLSPYQNYNGANWQAITDPINSLNHVAAVTSNNTAQVMMRMISNSPSGPWIYPNNPWMLQLHARVPANTKLSVRVSNSNGQTPPQAALSQDDLVFELEDGTNSNDQVKMYGIPIQHTKPNMFYTFIGFETERTTGTAQVIIDDVNLVALSGRFYYDIVTDNETGSATLGHQIAYIVVKGATGVCKMVKYDLNTQTSIWEKTITSNINGNAIVKATSDKNIIYIGQSQWTLLKTETAELNPSSISFSSKTLYNQDVCGTLTHADIRSINLFSGTNALYVGNDGGIIRSNDGGNCWLNYNKSGLATNLVFGFSNSETVRERVLFGAVDNGGLTNTPSAWVWVHDGDGYNGAINREDGNTGWSSYGGGDGVSELLRSTAITTWSFAEPAVPPFSDHQSMAVKQMYYHPWTNRLLCATNDIYVADESNAPTITWSNLNNGQLGSNATLAASINPALEKGIIMGMWVGKEFDKGIQYAVTSARKVSNVFKHTYTPGAPGTGNWESLKENIDGVNWFIYNTDNGGGFYNPLCVAADPDNPEHVWVGYGGMRSWNLTNPPDPDGRVIYSSNGGSTWVDLTRGLPFFPVTKLVYQEGTDDIIYAATDLGVYVWDKHYINEEGPNGKWLCFSNNLPNVVITDMEIVQCEGKLRVATWGRGIWQTDLPEIPANQQRELVISTNETWDTDKAVVTNVRIETGNTLTIANEAIIRMGYNTSIIVEPGAKLMVDDATITNTCSYWSGIIAQGNKLQPQDLSSANNAVAMSSNQAFVYLNNATIENAKIGVRAWNPDHGWISSDPNSPQGGTGGIVRAVNSTFRNVQEAAAFPSYHNISSGVETPNRSYFYKCIFETTNDMPQGIKPYSFITNWDTRGIRFLGCEFKNLSTITTATNENELGSGIIALDAPMIIRDYLFEKRNEFTNLQHGVYVMNSSGLNVTTVDHALFTNCIRGIRNEGVNMMRITGNDFVMGCNPAEINIGYFVDEGIILNQCNGYRVELNQFEPCTATLQHFTNIGIRANENGSPDNRIYKNYFNEVGFGNLTNGRNQNGDIFNPTGLHFECNENDDVEYADVAVIKTLTQLDGVRTRQGASNLSAGNEFSHNTGSLLLVPESDFYNEGVGLDYFYSGSSEFPQYRSASVNPQSPIGLPQNTCPSNYIFAPHSPSEWEVWDWGCVNCEGLAGYTGDYNTHRMAQNTYRNLYLGLIDGGNTQARLLMVDTITNGARLKDSLMSYAPNLSTTVLDAVSTKNALLGDTAQYLVMKANAEGVSYEILFYLEDRVELPGWMLDSISAARGNLSLRSYWLDTLTYHTAQKEFAHYNLLRLVQEDTFGFNLHLYRSWLDSADGWWAKREKVNSYLYEAKLDSAYALLQHYDTTLHYQPADSVQFKHYKNYTLAYINWINADSSIMRLDSANLAALRAYAAEAEYLKATNMARNVLNFFYDSLYFTPAVLPALGSGKKGNDELAQPALPNAQKLTQTPTLKLYPNPTQNNITVEYSNMQVGDKLLIADVFGVIYEQIILPDTSGKFLIHITHYPNGIYLTRTENKGKVMAKSKFIVMK